jgi:putative tryptophan/tyrosine transport system substrate-binding protein
MASYIGRRKFLAALGGAVAWPLAARAQQPDRVRHIGVLMPYVESDSEAQQWTKAFTQSLEQLGWVEGRNIRLDYRWPGPTTDRLKIDAGELVRSSPDLLVAGSTPAVVALKNETGSIPIVFANVADPVGQGFVGSLSTPTSNITGLGAFEFSIAGKWVQVIKDIVPSATKIGVIVNPETAPFYRLFLPFIDTAAGSLVVRLNITTIQESDDIPGTIDKLVKDSNAALIVLPAARFTAARERIIATVAQLRLPAIYPYSYYARSGGLISYGFDVGDMYRRAASYADRLLRGTRVSELPVQNPTKFELVINLKTAKALGLQIPDKLLALADEVIEW